ncbi:hypothetical protein, conserved in T. vivax, partial [Trypanosoma vivax Y486]
MRFRKGRSLSPTPAKTRANSAPSPGSCNDAPPLSSPHRAPPPSKASSRPALQRLHRVREVSVSDRLEGAPGGTPPTRRSAPPAARPRRATATGASREGTPTHAPASRLRAVDRTRPAGKNFPNGIGGGMARARGAGNWAPPASPEAKGHGAAPATQIAGGVGPIAQTAEKGGAPAPLIRVKKTKRSPALPPVPIYCLPFGPSLVALFAFSFRAIGKNGFFAVCARRPAATEKSHRRPRYEARRAKWAPDRQTEGGPFARGEESRKGSPSFGRPEALGAESERRPATFAPEERRKSRAPLTPTFRRESASQPTAKNSQRKPIASVSGAKATEVPCPRLPRRSCHSASREKRGARSKRRGHASRSAPFSFAGKTRPSNIDRPLRTRKRGQSAHCRPPLLPEAEAGQKMAPRRPAAEITRRPQQLRFRERAAIFGNRPPSCLDRVAAP